MLNQVEVSAVDLWNPGIGGVAFEQLPEVAGELSKVWNPGAEHLCSADKRF